MNNAHTLCPSNPTLWHSREILTIAQGCSLKHSENLETILRRCICKQTIKRTLWNTIINIYIFINLK